MNEMNMTAKEQGLTAPPTDRFIRLDWLSRLLDSAWSIPGTPYRIGLDGILGFIPGIGDPLGMMLSSYIIFEAARIGAPKHILLRMIGNVALESIVGIVPILGDVFDVVWKANMRNLALLRSHKVEVFTHERTSRQIMILILAPLLLILVGLIAVSVLALRFIYGLIRS